MDVFDSFQAASADLADTEQVCGTYVDEKPRYFVLPKSASETEVRDRAFEVREGRRPSPYEEFLMSQAEKMKVDA